MGVCLLARQLSIIIVFSAFFKNSRYMRYHPNRFAFDSVEFVMNGKITLVALVLIVAASGVSVGLQMTGGGVDIPAVKQLGSATPTISQAGDVPGTVEATESVATPDSTDCLPIEAKPVATLEATQKAISTISSTFVITPTATLACPPFEATPDFVVTPESTPEATEDSSDDRGRGGGSDSSGRGGGDDNSGHGGGSDHSGRGGGDD